MTPRAIGFVCGLVLIALVWAGNVTRADTLTISAFPDPMTMLAVPISCYFALRYRHRREPAANLPRLRRVGWSVVNTQAAVFAIGVAMLAASRLGADLQGETLVFLTALLLAAGLGYVSVEVWARLMLHGRRA